MHKVCVIGGGKIGTLICFLLTHSKQYHVYLIDNQPLNPQLSELTHSPHFSFFSIDANDIDAISDLIKQYDIDAIVSSLPFYNNLSIAKLAAIMNRHYFDLTEDVKTTQQVEELSKKTRAAFVPQCGLAPGFISIVTHSLMTHFPTLDTVKMRVGALPINISNQLEYSLTWSTDGLINEYGNPCQAIENGKEIELLPLEGLEEIKIDGLTYEAFNTSGGVGSLAKSYLGKVKHLSYKTIRYPGHCSKVKFLMNDLRLNEDRETLKRILERAIPKTYQDVVLVYVSVTGIQDNQLIEESYVKKFYPKQMYGYRWSAIQLTTASGLCSALDLVLTYPNQYSGFIRQEQFRLDSIIGNRFGGYYS